MKMSAIEWVAFILVVICALNWALFDFGTNLVETIAGAGTVAKVIYVLVGLSGLFMLIGAFTKK